MGIPGYFSKYASKYPDTIIKRKLELIDALFLDFNCAIHPCCRKFSREHYSHNRKDICEKHMIEECLAHLLKLIKYSNPRRLIYIAIDGVAPRAKMTQQRNRRFKSIKEREMDNELKEKTGYVDPNITQELKEHSNEYWDSNSISPGTVFMTKLSDALKKFFTESNDPQLESLTIIISDSNQPGEGEHKILEYIRKNNKDFENNNIVIYGLDADLIMLSMVSHINRIYLLRESTEFGKEYFDEGTSFCYLDIDLFKYSIIQELCSKIPPKIKLEMIDKLQLLDDYIFICFMIGNDFLPNLPPLNIKDSGLDLLTDIYTSTFTETAKIVKKYHWVRDDTIYTGDATGTDMESGWRSDRSTYDEIIKLEFLVNTENCTINHSFLTKIFEKLGNEEYNLMVKLETKREKLRPGRQNNQHNSNANNGNFNNKNNQQYEFEKNLMENYPILNRDEEISINIRHQDKNWQLRYYSVCFHFEPTRDNIDTACLKYLQGLLWTLTYYYKGCYAWDWYYPYHHSPTIYNIYKFVNDIDKWKTIKLSKSEPYKPFEQLMCILPPESKHLLPDSYQSLICSTSPIIQYYPESYKFDTIYRRFFWQCPPILPPINSSHLRKVLQKKSLTKEEQLRDQITLPIIIKGNKSHLI
jgi:5'-3' exonuclease